MIWELVKALCVSLSSDSWNPNKAMCSCNPSSKWTVRSQGLPGQLIYPKKFGSKFNKTPCLKKHSGEQQRKIPVSTCAHTHTWYWGAMQPCEVPSAELCPALLISSPNSSGVGCHQNFLKVRKLKQLSLPALHSWWLAEQGLGQERAPLRR